MEINRSVLNKTIKCLDNVKLLLSSELQRIISVYPEIEAERESECRRISGHYRVLEETRDSLYDIMDRIEFKVKKEELND